MLSWEYGKRRFPAYREGLSLILCGMSTHLADFASQDKSLGFIAVAFSLLRKWFVLSG